MSTNSSMIDKQAEFGQFYRRFLISQTKRS